MEIKLRLILFIFGLIILLGVAWDVFRRRPMKTKLSQSFWHKNNELLAETLRNQGSDNPYSLEPPMNVAVNASHSQRAPEIGPDFLEATDAIAVDKTTVPEMPLEIELEQFDQIVMAAAPERDDHTEVMEQPVETLSRQDMISVSIMSRNKEGFLGSELEQALKSARFYFGEMNIFHRHEQEDGSGKCLFSLAQAKEPGWFNLDTLNNEKIPGITLFFSLSDIHHPLRVFDLLIQSAKRLSFSLNGEILDHNYQPLTLTTIEEYKQRIKNSTVKFGS